VKIKRSVLVGGVVFALYVGLVAYGAAHRHSLCWPDAEIVIQFAKDEEGSLGHYAARRVVPHIDECVPFRSVFVVSRDGKDCARITLTRPIWTGDSSITYARLGKKT
jgi:hypothetical protein